MNKITALTEKDISYVYGGFLSQIDEHPYIASSLYIASFTFGFAASIFAVCVSQVGGLGKFISVLGGLIK